MLVCDNPEDPTDRRLIGMSALGPDYCGTEVISALFTNLLTYKEWIANYILGVHTRVWMSN